MKSLSDFPVYSVRRDRRGVRPVVGHPGHRLHRRLVPRVPVHGVCRGRVRPLQRHPGGQGFDAGAQLPDSRGNDSEPRRHLPDPRRTFLALLQSVSPAAWTQLRHDLRVSVDKDEPDRPDPRRLQEALSDQETAVHVRSRPGASPCPLPSIHTGCFKKCICIGGILLVSFSFLSTFPLI